MREFSMRPEILAFDPYKPGLTIEEIKSRYGLTNVIKLASNENPLGTSPIVQKVLARHADRVFRYPQNHSPKLTAELAAYHEVPEQCIVAGNGSDELIDMLIRMRCVAGQDNVICYSNAFSMYRLTAKLCGVEYREVPRDENFGLPLAGLAEAADANTRMVFVTSPDNPTGLAAGVEELSVLAGACRKTVCSLWTRPTSTSSGRPSPTPRYRPSINSKTSWCCAPSPKPTDWPDCASATGSCLRSLRTACAARESPSP